MNENQQLCAHLFDTLLATAALLKMGRGPLAYHS